MGIEEFRYAVDFLPDEKGTPNKLRRRVALFIDEPTTGNIDVLVESYGAGTYEIRELTSGKLLHSYWLVKLGHKTKELLDDFKIERGIDNDSDALNAVLDEFRKTLKNK